MEASIIDLVERKLEVTDWQGMLYIMGWGTLENFQPLYVGKAGKKGVKNALSANLLNLRRDRNTFARWGDNL